jgi:2-methylcitrate dehydratase PrpD
LEDRHGFLSLFSVNPDLSWLVDGWGSHFEIRANNFKAYPCGIVIHPVIDACLKLHQEIELSRAGVRKVEIEVAPVATQLADRATPSNEFEAQVSLQHWAAAALLRGRAGIAEGSNEALRDPALRRLRARCTVRSAPDLPIDAARVYVYFKNDTKECCKISHCRGSSNNPLTEEDLRHKFVDQATPTLGRSRARRAFERCRTLTSAPDVSGVWRELW